MLEGLCADCTKCTEYLHAAVPSKHTFEGRKPKTEAARCLKMWTSIVYPRVRAALFFDDFDEVRPFPRKCEILVQFSILDGKTYLVYAIYT